MGNNNSSFILSKLIDRIITEKNELTAENELLRDESLKLKIVLRYILDHASVVFDKGYGENWLEEVEKLIDSPPQCREVK